MKLWLMLAALALLVIMAVTDEVKRPPGVLAADEPHQGYGSGTAAWGKDGFRVTPLADFDLRARVLHTERYWFDAASRFSPIDLAVGWGPMSDSAVLRSLIITQGQRWYSWQGRGGHPPLPREEIVSHSANMHMIPDTAEVRKALLAVRKGHIVQLNGYLVEISGPAGWRWKSSLSRTDTGAGSCEVVWVKRISFD